VCCFTVQEYTRKIRCTSSPCLILLTQVPYVPTPPSPRRHTKTYSHLPTGLRDGDRRPLCDSAQRSRPCSGTEWRSETSITPHLMSSLNKLSTSTSAWSPPFLLRDREQVLSLRACLRARPSPKGHTIQVCPRYHNGLRCCSEGAGAPSLRTVALAVFVAALTKKQLLDDDVPIQDRKRKRVVFEEHEDDLERSIPMYKHLLLSSSKSQLNPPLDSKSSGRNACPKRAAQQGASIIPGAPRERAPAAPRPRRVAHANLQSHC